MWGRGFAGLRLVGRSIHKIDIEPAVIVVVQQANAGALGFEDELLLRSARLVTPSRKASGRGDILKDNGAGLHKSTGGEGAVLAVEFRLLRAGGGHPSAGLLHCGGGGVGLQGRCAGCRGLLRTQPGDACHCNDHEEDRKSRSSREGMRTGSVILQSAPHAEQGTIDFHCRFSISSVLLFTSALIQGCVPQMFRLLRTGCEVRSGEQKLNLLFDLAEVGFSLKPGANHAAAVNKIGNREAEDSAV